MEFFRRCPSCGKRFHVELEKKILLDQQKEERDGRLGGIAIIDINLYQYNYRCDACGHEWSEKRTVEDLQSAS